MPQHQDPIVYNATVGTWQNASNTTPSGQAVGMTIGDPAGSTVAMVPAQGQILTVDGSDVWTVQSAVQYATNTLTEVQPGYSCGLVLNEGDPVTETLAMLHLSSMSVEGMAVLMASMNAGSTVHGYIKTGLLQTDGAGGWTFTTVQTLTSQAAGGAAGQHLLSAGWGLFGIDPHSSAPAVWTHLDTLTQGLPMNGYSDGGSITEYSPQYHYSPLHNGVLFFRGVVNCPTNPSNQALNFSVLPAEYHPSNSCRYAITVVGVSNSQQGGYLFIAEQGGMSFHAINSTITTPTIDITGHIHLGAAA